MEMFKYTSPDGQVVYFGYRLPENTNPKEFFLIDSYDGLTAADIEPITIKGYGQNGYTLGSISYGARYINLNFLSQGLDIKDMYRKRRYLAQVFNPLLGEGTLTYTNNFLSKSIKCIPTITPTPVQRMGLLDLMNIELTCYNPYWFDNSEQSVLLDGFEGGLQFPIEFNKQVKFAERGNSATINIEGDVPSPIRVNFSGNMVNPRLVLEETGEFIEVATTVASGTITITTEYGNKNVLRNGASAYHLINPDSTFFQLRQGTNTLRFMPNSGSIKVRVYWRNYYVGV